MNQMNNNGRSFTANDLSGFAVINLDRDSVHGRWYATEFSPVPYNEVRKDPQMIRVTHKAGKTLHVYLSAITDSQFHRIFETMAEAKVYAASRNNKARGVREDRRLIASGGRYM